MSHLSKLGSQGNDIFNYLGSKIIDNHWWWHPDLKLDSRFSGNFIIQNNKMKYCAPKVSNKKILWFSSPSSGKRRLVKPWFCWHLPQLDSNKLSLKELGEICDQNILMYVLGRHHLIITWINLQNKLCISWNSMCWKVL